MAMEEGGDDIWKTFNGELGRISDFYLKKVWKETLPSCWQTMEVSISGRPHVMGRTYAMERCALVFQHHSTTSVAHISLKAHNLRCGAGGSLCAIDWSSILNEWCMLPLVNSILHPWRVR